VPRSGARASPCLPQQLPTANSADSAACENFLYGFKAAPAGPLAPPTRRTASAPLRFPLRRRKRRSGWRDM
jgi:hypothetical protein